MLVLVLMLVLVCMWVSVLKYAEEFRSIVARQVTENPKLTPRSPWPSVQVDEGSALHAELGKTTRGE